MLKKIVGQDIIESGSNANGEYHKFANGLMICQGTLFKRGKVNTPWGTLYYLDMGGITFPKPFIKNPQVNVSSNVARGGWFLQAYLSKTGVGTIEWYRAVADTNDNNLEIIYTAIGKWK